MSGEEKDGATAFVEEQRVEEAPVGVVDKEWEKVQGFGVESKGDEGREGYSSFCTGAVREILEESYKVTQKTHLKALHQGSEFQLVKLPLLSCCWWIGRRALSILVPQG